MMNIEESYLKLGNLAVREHRYREAVGLYTKALAQSPIQASLIQANIEFAKSRLATSNITDRLADNRVSVVCAENPQHQPDFFSIKAHNPMADILILSWVSSHSDLIAVLHSANRMTIAHECLILASRSILDSLTVSILPQHCKQLQIIAFPTISNRSSSFIRTLNQGIITKYSDVLWFDPSCSRDIQVAALERSYRNEISDVGILAERLTTTGEVRSPFRDKYLGSWLARLHRTSRDTRILVPQQSFCVKGVILNQVAAMNISPAKFDGLSQTDEADAFNTIAAAIGISSQEGLFEAAEYKNVLLNNLSPPTDDRSKRIVKSIAFYLPQFHPIPENDSWWGKGFTEWNNVIKAKPLFRSHYQPKLPADLGFYDLRSESVQLAQTNLAQHYGIHGFCYYYYWFNGKKLLNQPIESMLASKKIDFPFCVCWANENWSRNWDGQNKHVLMSQEYSKDSNLALIHEFIKLMKDDRYITHNGRPVLLVYRIRIIPNWLETSKMWREECRKAGVGEIHLCSIRFGLEPLEGPPALHGLDAYVMFPPQDMNFVDAKPDVWDLNTGFGGTMYKYDEVVEGDISRFRPGYEWPVHRGAMMGWDNTARRQTSARVFVGCTPMKYRSWLKRILQQEDRHNPTNESLLFINAWNEWAEGTTLEPDQKFKSGYLEATQSALIGYSLAKNAKSESNIERDPSLFPVQQSHFIKKYKPIIYPLHWQGKEALRANQPTVLLCAHISGHYLFGGERSFVDVISTLRRLELNVVVTLPSSNNKEYINMLSEHANAVYTFPYSQWTENRPANVQITLLFADIIAKHNVSIVYSNTIVLIEPAEAARLMGRISITHIRELITLDDGLRDRIGLPVQEIIKSVFQRYQFAIANSAATEKAFARAGRTFYAPNAVDHRVIATPNVISQRIKFGIVSSNIPKKGISDIIEVAKACQDMANEIEFIIVGPDNVHTEIWKKEISLGTLPNNIKFLGYRDSPKLAIAEMNVLLNLSNFAESFGRTVAEAMAASRPVIAYEWGALPELVVHGKNGYLVPFGDIANVAIHIRKIVSNRNLIQKLGNNGFKYISSKFSHEELYKRLKTAFAAIYNSEQWSKNHNSWLGKAQANNVTIVIPVYNASVEVRACLESVLQHTPPNIDILIINDGSTDPEIPKILAMYNGLGAIKVVENSKNIGYTKTVNRGISEAGINDVLLLNSDTIVTPGWLQGMRASAYADPTTGTVTAMSDNAGAFSFPNQGIPNPKPEYLTNEEYAVELVNATFYSDFVDVPTGSGFCFYIKRALFADVGNFDEVLFPRGYGEENYFCMRARELGWKNVITPWVFIYHIRSASFKSEKDQLVKAGVEQVIRKYPDYAAQVKAAFSSEAIMRLRELSSVRRRS